MVHASFAKLASLLVLASAFSACHHATDASTPSAAPSTAAAQATEDEALHTQAQRVVASTTAAAEYLRIFVPAARVAAIPEQVKEFSILDFQQEGWEKVGRFAQYSADPILSAQADLVLTHAWQSAETTAALRARDVPVMVLDSAQSWDDIARNLRRIGHVLKLDDEAEHEILRRGNVVARLAREAKKRKPMKALVYSNDGTGGWTAGIGTTVDTVLRMAGLSNVSADAKLSGHVQIDFERLIALDPDVIVLGAAHPGEETATQHVLSTTPILAKMRAVDQKRIITLGSQLLSSDSPTMVEAADQLATSVDDILAGRVPQK